MSALTRARGLALCFIVSLVSHLPGLFSPPLDYHHHRQTQTAAIARNYYRDGLNILKPRLDWAGPNAKRAGCELPIYMWLMGLLWPLGGLGAVWGRVLAALFSALTSVYLVLFLEDRGFKRAEALAAGLFFSCLPVEIFFGRTVQPEAISLWATMAALFHWQRYLRNNATAQAVYAAAAVFLAVGHKLPYAYIGLVLLALSWERLGARLFKEPGHWAAAAAAVAGVLAWYVYASSGAFVVPTTKGGIAVELNYDRLPYYLFFETTSRLPELVLTYSGIIFAAASFSELRRRGQAFFFCAWAAAIALSLAAEGGYAFYHEYTCLPLAPVAASLIGLGFVRLWNLASKRWALIGLCVLALGVPVHAALRIGHWYRISLPYVLGAQAAAAKVSAPGDLFLCNERATSTLLYVIDRRGWSWDFPEAPAATPLRIEEHRREGARYLMSALSQLPKTMEAQLAARYPTVYRDSELVIYDLKGSSTGRAPR